MVVAASWWVRSSYCKDGRACVVTLASRLAQLKGKFKRSQLQQR